MEKEQRKRTEMIPYLQDAMEETFQCTCREIQTVLGTNACRIWRGFHDAVCECLETTGALQRRNQKGRLGYLAFSMMRHALWLDRLELRIDALDDTFYLDTAEASAQYRADFLQDRFRKDLECLYEKARSRFIRIQNNELVQIRQAYAEYYYSLLFCMTEFLTGLIRETVAGSGTETADGFRIICGGYMDKAVVLYKERKRMKYFLIGTDEKNRIPYNINKNRMVDVRTLTREGIGTLPMWNIIGMDLPDEGFFPDLICSPFVLMSKTCIKTAAMYQPDIIYRGVKLWDKGSGVNRTYYLSILEELDCMSGQTQFNTVGNRVTRLVLDRDRIGGNAVFRIKGYNRGCIAGRLDFVESLLRRGIEGITLEEAALA